MSSSHKVIWTIEILKFCSYDLSTGLPTLGDGQPHVYLLQCDIDRGQNVSDRDGIQLTAMGAECDNSLIHFIALITIDHFGIGEHLECRSSCPEFIQFVCCFIVVTFEPPRIFDHSSVRLELLLSFPFITYDPVVTRTVFAILWHKILPSRRFVNSDQCLPLPTANSLHFSY